MSGFAVPIMSLIAREWMILLDRGLARAIVRASVRSWTLLLAESSVIF
jgi:hypothetical protein